MGKTIIEVSEFYSEEKTGEERTPAKAEKPKTVKRKKNKERRRKFPEKGWKTYK